MTIRRYCSLEVWGDFLPRCLRCCSCCHFAVLSWCRFCGYSRTQYHPAIHCSNTTIYVIVLWIYIPWCGDHLNMPYWTQKKTCLKSPAPCITWKCTTGTHTTFNKCYNWTFLIILEKYDCGYIRISQRVNMLQQIFCNLHLR